MNRTYFGDTRDLFKFDLVRHLMKALPGFESFTFVPMLTEGVGKASRKKSATKDMEKAYKTGKAGSQNIDLLSHMERLQEIDDDLEYFRQIESYFKKERIIIDIIHQNVFSQIHRKKYFDDLYSKFPKKSLIFLDPDTGLEESTSSEKHLLFTEVKKIYDRMDPGSVMMIYQHFPRVKHDGYIKNRSKQIRELTSATPCTITDNEIVFFLLAKNEKKQQQLQDVLELYANTYPMLDSVVCES
jgi:hypothetical protein